MKKSYSKSIMKGLAVLGGASLLLTACAGGDTGGGGDADGGNGDEIVIGLALSQSGNMAPFDVEPGIAFNLAIDQINADGGVDGRTIRVIEKDVASNPETVGLAAQELLDEGMNIFVGPCDFDLSSPGLIAAQSAGIPGISICAGAPETADLTTVGDFSFSGHPGSDTEGVAAAEWALSQGWENAFLLRDTSIEYTKSTGNYFEAAYLEGGGTIVAEESTPGGDTVDISSQVNALSAVQDEIDVVYVASWNPGGATMMKQIRDAGIEVPLIGAAAMDGLALSEILGGSVSDVYITALGCYVFCTGTEDNEALTQFAADFAETTGSDPSTAYATTGYNLALALANALEQTEELDGTSIRDAMRDAPEFDSLIGTMKYFSDTCHKPLDYPMSIVELNAGQFSLVEQVRVASLPDLDDGNSCATG